MGSNVFKNFLDRKAARPVTCLLFSTTKRAPDVSYFETERLYKLAFWTERLHGTDHIFHRKTLILGILDRRAIQFWYFGQNNFNGFFGKKTSP